MPESQLLNDRRYGLTEGAVLSRRLISQISNRYGFARIDAVLESPRAPVATRLQVKCGDRNWIISLNNAIHPLPNWFLPTVGELTRLLGLLSGWNSYSAKSIASENAAAALEVLINLSDFNTPPPTVVPRVQGNIQLEWHVGEVDIEIYVDSPDSVQFFAEDASDDLTAEGSLLGREQELREWFGRLTSD